MSFWIPLSGSPCKSLLAGLQYPGTLGRQNGEIETSLIILSRVDSALGLVVTEAVKHNRMKPTCAVPRRAEPTVNTRRRRGNHRTRGGKGAQ